jgi:hypothetical protein
MRDLIAPYIENTYGKSHMAAALADELAFRLEDYHKPDRTDFIMRICWNWFPGGTTAANVAERIDAALRTWRTDLIDRGDAA